uniref:Preprotein translocase subunit SecY n=1 Tax=Neotessella volvocina TaxID=52559 RepID=A0A3G2R0E0_9STRA|nr:preprotein translocase subunit SecY [Neotessella volvocina]
MKKFFLKKSRSNSPTQKILLTFFILLLFRFGNSIPLGNIDQIALQKAFLQIDSNNPLLQVLSLYTGGGGGNTLISPFSLGIIPFINASIFIDLLTTLIPALEKLQTEEGELGRQRLNFYKKLLTLVFAIGQSILLLIYLKPYFYTTNLFNSIFLVTELSTGALIFIWLSNLIDKKGIGNGTSLIIFINIVANLFHRNLLTVSRIDFSFFLQLFFLFLVLFLISLLQTTRFNIDVVSARQLTLLKNAEKNQLTDRNDIMKNYSSNLSIRLNQAGIFPLIIAANILPFLNYIGNFFFLTSKLKLLNNIFYYLLIIAFNYFYTIVFWDPEKIAEQLRKASVSVVNITPGRDTVVYLNNIVRTTSILGGVCLCFILMLFELIKDVVPGSFLNQINISSLIILVGVSYELQRTLQTLYKNI